MSGSGTATGGSLNSVGNISKALLDALDQIERYVSASQVGPDGKPLGSAIYMHMPTGYPIDPKMFANAWTPGGGDSSSSFGDDGTFVAAPVQQAAATTTASAGSGPAGSVYPPPTPAPDQPLEDFIQNAWYTSMLVDQMLEVTQNGIATAWPDRNVSIEYYTVLQGIQPLQNTPPAQSVVNAVAAAQNLLYLKDNNGNFIGYTQLYAQYRKNRTAWLMPSAPRPRLMPRQWPIPSPVRHGRWRRRHTPMPCNLRSTISTAWAASKSKMRSTRLQPRAKAQSSRSRHSRIRCTTPMRSRWVDRFRSTCRGRLSVRCPGGMPPTSPSACRKSPARARRTTPKRARAPRRSQATGSNSNRCRPVRAADFSIGFAGASATGSHADASNAFGDHASQYSWTSHADNSTTASVSLEFFLAKIDRPWLLGDIFNIGGWYLVGQRKNSISDGTIANQIGQKTSAILPMLPMAFLIIRNVSITCDDFGDVGNTFNAARQNDGGTGQSSANSVGVKANYLFASASANYAGQQSSGAFGSNTSTSGVTFTSDNKKGGTLSITGSQICGWVGQIQLAAPQIDHPHCRRCRNRKRAQRRRRLLRRVQAASSCPTPINWRRSAKS